MTKEPAGFGSLLLNREVEQDSDTCYNPFTTVHTWVWTNEGLCVRISRIKVKTLKFSGIIYQMKGKISYSFVSIFVNKLLPLSHVLILPWYLLSKPGIISENRSIFKTNEDSHHLHHNLQPTVCPRKDWFSS